jgi:hypothetical protein
VIRKMGQTTIESEDEDQDEDTDGESDESDREDLRLYYYRHHNGAALHGIVPVANSVGDDYRVQRFPPLNDDDMD